MLTLSIENSYTSVKQASLEVEQLIAETLTYENEEAKYELQRVKYQLGMSKRMGDRRRLGWFAKKAKELQAALEVCWYQDGRFPTGHLPLIEKLLKDNGHEFKLDDRREPPTPSINLKWKRDPLEARYYQKEAVQLAIEACRGVVEHAVGTGKSLCMQYLINHCSVPTLVIVPSKDLGTQLADGFKEMFGSNRVDVITTAKLKSSFNLKPIRVVTIQTLGSLIKRGGLKRLISDIQCVMVDEVHHCGAGTYLALLPHLNHVFYRYGFSGSFLRNDSKTLDMWGFLSTVLHTYKAGQAVKDGYLTPLKVIVHTLPGIKKSNYQTEYTKNYCGNLLLMDEIVDIIQNGIDPGDQVLTMVGRKDQSGKLLNEYLEQQGIPNTFISGDDKKDLVKKALSDFNDKSLQCLIGSSIIGEGIDIRSTNHLIMAQGGRSEIAITQAAGRGVRLFPGKEIAFLHDFRFEGTKYLESHLEARLRIYKQNFDAEIIEI